jgi:hypothetical protein
MDFKNRTWVMTVVIFRVLITLGIMMTLFLGMWIGYFTIPIILIGAFSIILAISDLSFLFTLRKNKNLSSEILDTNEKSEKLENKDADIIDNEY